MSRAAGLIWLSLAALGAAVVTPARSQPDAPQQPSERPLGMSAAGDDSAARFVGSQSCAAAACHGSPLAAKEDPATPWREALRNEFLIWFDRDPHSKSSHTLTTQESRKMISALARSLDVSFDKAAAKCAACHDPMAGRISSAGAKSRADTRQGVGCEFCHGAAGDKADDARELDSKGWLHEHYDEAWLRLQPGEKAVRGMNDTANLEARARLCVDCHVGAPGREVNHDFIAAGHPPLKFELTAYVDFLKQLGAIHWNDTAERAATPDFELRSWIIGRLTSQAAALEQTARRATAVRNEDRSAPWPEFSEFDCTSCHHSLVHESWRRNRASGAALGRPRWQSWYFGEQPGEQVFEWRPELESFAQPDEHMRQAMVDNAKKLRGLAESIAARAADAEFVALLKEPMATPFGRFDGKTISPSDFKVGSWDDACQAYLGLAAVEQAHRDQPIRATAPSTKTTTEIDRLLRDLRARLAEPRKHEEQVSREAILRALEELLAAMREGGRFE